MFRQENRQSEQESFTSADKIMASKKRAAFGDITNSSVISHDSVKKHCSGKPITDVKICDVEPSSISELNNQYYNVIDTGDQLITELRPAQQHVPCSMDMTINDDTSCADDQPENQTTAVEDMSILLDNNNSENSHVVDWVDVDKENLHLPAHVALYVNDIFDYYKNRELNYTISDYMSRQSDITTGMRAILVDWLVEVQQNFELNHETLYTAVKLTDRYIDKQQSDVGKDRLQLIGAAALNIASKFEERSPPVIDDFLYICDDAYTRDELLSMEISILKIVDFDIGFPLSYTFLRRFAQCARVAIPTLTLARYVLETSLMDYSFVNCRESKLAAAALLLAINMNVEGHWDSTMKHYTGYEVNELASLVCQLNSMIARPPQKAGLNAIETKYSHPVFHKVAKISVLSTTELELLCTCGSSRRKSALNS